MPWNKRLFKHRHCLFQWSLSTFGVLEQPMVGGPLTLHCKILAQLVISVRWKRADTLHHAHGQMLGWDELSEAPLKEFVMFRTRDAATLGTSFFPKTSYVTTITEVKIKYECWRAHTAWPPADITNLPGLLSTSHQCLVMVAPAVLCSQESPRPLMQLKSPS